MQLRGIRLLGRDGARLIDVVHGRVVAASATSAGAAADSQGAEFVAVPGLVEAHAHVSFFPPAAMSELASAGVRVLRDVGGAPVLLKPWTADDGRRHPLVLSYGEPLEGEPRDPRAAVFRAKLVRDLADVERHLAGLKKAGARGIKLYYTFPRALVERTVALSHEQELAVAGHLGSGSHPSFGTVTPEEFASAGGDTVEHVHSFTASLLAPAALASLDRQLRTASPFTRLFAAWSQVELDGALLGRAIEHFVRHRSAVVPTLSILAEMGGLLRRNGAGWPELTWDIDRRFAYVAEGFRKMMAFVCRLHQAGARILVGSDSATTDGLIPHGLALRLECELLHIAGIEPKDVMVAATYQSADVLRVSDQMRVDVGEPANLVVFRGNDEHDILAAWKILAVFCDGQLIGPPGEVDADR